VAVAALSVDPPAVSEKLRARLGLEIPFVCDPEGTLFDVLDIREAGGLPPPAISGAEIERQTTDIFKPTTFLLDPEGVVRWVVRPESYRVRADIDEVVAAIDHLTGLAVGP
jgi:peroxiredoxin